MQLPRLFTVFAVGFFLIAFCCSNLLAQQHLGCYLDVADPPKCEDNGLASECDAECKQKAIPNTNPVQFEWVCKNTTEYRDFFENTEVPKVRVAFMGETGGDSKDVYQVTCVRYYECECLNIGGWTCTAGDGAGNIVEQQTAEASDGQDCQGVVPPAIP